MELPGLKKYLANLRSPREKDWFRKHLRKYIQMYHPDSPFEVTTTNRYIITEHEAAICARKFIKAGQEIKFLSGTLVSMTKEEEKDLGLTRKDFSVVMSSRRKAPSFFLGPARFANHDCDANGRLVTRGNEGMSVMATRNIHEGEEITVSYGEDYFGIDNCECLCQTCERAVRNGWSPRVDSDSNSKESTPVSLDETAAAGTPPAGKKRRRESDVDSEDVASICSTPRKRTKIARTTSKLREEISISELPNEAPSTPVSQSCASAAATPTTGACEVSQLKQETVLSQSSGSALQVLSPDVPLPSIVETDGSGLKQPDHSTGDEGSAAPNNPNDTADAPAAATTDCDSPSSGTGESRRSPTSSVTSVDEIGLRPEAPQPAKTKLHKPGEVNVESLPDVSMTGQPESATRSPGSELSDLPESFKLDDTLETVVEKTPKTRKTRRDWRIISSVETETPTVRSPGDYTKTSRLLALKYDRWVDCQTCEAWFVQSNSYQTRRECPRCERHSKLYGFQWPNTDKGPDGEKRIMDHRIIHRFLSPDSEARVSRRDRGVSFGVTPTPELSDARTDTDQSDAHDSRRNTRASRRRTRELRMTM